jgi:hypothetical protein
MAKRKRNKLKKKKTFKVGDLVTSSLYSGRLGIIVEVTERFYRGHWTDGGAFETNSVYLEHVG